MHGGELSPTKWDAAKQRVTPLVRSLPGVLKADPVMQQNMTLLSFFLFFYIFFIAGIGSHSTFRQKASLLSLLELNTPACSSVCFHTSYFSCLLFPISTLFVFSFSFQFSIPVSPLIFDFQPFRLHSCFFSSTCWSSVLLYFFFCWNTHPNPPLSAFVSFSSSVPTLASKFLMHKSGICEWRWRFLQSFAHNKSFYWLFYLYVHRFLMFPLWAPFLRKTISLLSNTFIIGMRNIGFLADVPIY